LSAVYDQGVAEQERGLVGTSQTTAAAISSGAPIRPIGSCAVIAARPSGVPPLTRWIIAVSVMPGQMALIRMLEAVESSAADLLRPTTPNVEAE
jgi:hypothetical protein